MHESIESFLDKKIIAKEKRKQQKLENVQDKEKPLNYPKTCLSLIKKMLTYPGSKICTKEFNQSNRSFLNDQYEAFDILAVSKQAYSNYNKKH